MHEAMYFQASAVINCKTGSRNTKKPKLLSNFGFKKMPDEVTFRGMLCFIAYIGTM